MMPGRPSRITEQDRAKMRKRYAECGNAKAVARELGCQPYEIKRAVDPAYNERYLRKRREYQRDRYIPVERRKLDPVVFNYDPLYDPRRDGYPVYADAQAELLGDPPVGRREMIARHVPDYEAGDDEPDYGDDDE
jgi:hypothetical protein